MTNLFQLGQFTLASGQTTSFKIDCDALTDKDWETLAHMLRLYMPEPWRTFREVRGVPTGGLKLASALEKYANPHGPSKLLIVDDVYTTGKSLSEYANTYQHSYAKQYRNILYAVIFSRTAGYPSNVFSLFKMQV